MQALIDAGIEIPDSEREAGERVLAPEQYEQALAMCRSVRATLGEQSAGWVVSFLS